MFSTAMDYAQLFIKGKMFQDQSLVMRQFAMGAGVGALVLILFAQFAPVWVAALAGGAVAGFLQPILFKDLKYA